MAAASWLPWPPASCPSRPKAADYRSPATGSGARRWSAEGRMTQASPGRTLALRSSDRCGAELVFEAVERRELVEPSRGTDRHCRHQELTQKDYRTDGVLCLDSICSYSSRCTWGWGGICSEGFSRCVGERLLITCGPAWENCHSRSGRCRHPESASHTFGERPPTHLCRYSPGAEPGEAGTQHLPRTNTT